MFQRVFAACLQGIEAIPVEVEVDSTPGLPGFSLVGLPDGAVRESRERVVSALRSSGFLGGGSRLTVNLAPADLRKEGAGLDLGLALGILMATEQLRVPDCGSMLFLGELSLDGRLRPVRGVLSAVAMWVARHGEKAVIVVPSENAAEALCVPGACVLAPSSLEECCAALEAGPTSWSRARVSKAQGLAYADAPDFSSVLGLEGVKRALEICAAGMHNFLLVGSPGTGKTLSARCLPGILPPLDEEEALETTRIHSCAGLLPPGGGLLRIRPFRAPHHSSSAAALSGGARLRPGEASLAHNGVLFLDELPEFHRDALESLRQPLEEGCIRLERAAGGRHWPAHFLLGAAMNPCPCGYAMDTRRPCRCLPDAVLRYRQRVSGPLLDRIDLQVTVPTTPLDIRLGTSESSMTMRERVLQARALQAGRRVQAGAMHNGNVSGDHIQGVLNWTAETERFALQAGDRLALSRRAYYRLLKVARTIADLRGEGVVQITDIAEAIQYRGVEAAWR